MDAYPEQHVDGFITLENQHLFTENAFQGDLGVQIASDGRVWVCINGVAFIRCTPFPNRKMSPDAVNTDLGGHYASDDG